MPGARPGATRPSAGERGSGGAWGLRDLQGLWGPTPEVHGKLRALIAGKLPTAPVDFVPWILFIPCLRCWQ